jgi:quinone-modifying oxidoreductase, subunit QmoA
MAEKKILIVGGGISGISAAVEAAEVGHEVVLIEREPYLGGRVVGMHQYFPKLCPPTCGLEINYQRLKNNPRIRVLTLAEVVNVAGGPGDFTVTVRVKPRYVTGAAPLAKAHFDAVVSEVPDGYNLGLKTRKALSLPHPMAFPYQYQLDKEALTAAELDALAAAEPKAALDLDMKTRAIEFKAGAIIIATGWKPFDAGKMPDLGFGRFPNVINNVQLERFCAPTGPTGGKVVRPSDHQAPRKVAFVQCVGSRDENHLPYCSGVCCMATLKHCRYVRALLPEAEITVYYIDIRPISRLEKFYLDLLQDDQIKFVKGMVPRITEAAGNRPVLHVEEIMNGRRAEVEADLAVLAAGMVPNTADEKLPGIDAGYDDYGFVADRPGSGLIGAGCVHRPLDVSGSVKDATAAALKAIQAVRR